MGFPFPRPNDRFGSDRLQPRQFQVISSRTKETYYRLVRLVLLVDACVVLSSAASVSHSSL